VREDALVHVGPDDAAPRADDPGDLDRRVSAPAAEIDYVQAGRKPCAIQHRQRSGAHDARQHAEPLGAGVPAAKNVMRPVRHRCTLIFQGDRPTGLVGWPFAS
jgi:hypothetical protein